MKSVMLGGLLAGCACFTLVFVPSPCAAWILDGTPVCTAPDGQDHPVLAPDGTGGAFYTWRDARGGEFDIYCQRLDAQGNPLWTTDGIVICDRPDAQTMPQIMADGAGGAFIVWHHYHDNERDLHAQRVGADGTVLWAENGIVICDAPGHQEGQVLVPDGEGGLIIAWHDERSGEADIYAQRMDPDGNSLWAGNGICVVDAEHWQTSPQMISDGQGGAIVVWLDGREITTDVYAQRINGSGATLWTAGGVPICTAAEHQRVARIASDGAGGAIISWHDVREPGLVLVYVQRVNAGGVLQWTIDGAAIAPLNIGQTNAHIVSDDAGGAIITWNQDVPGGDAIYAQRVDDDGTPLWTSSGVALGGETGNTAHPRIVADGQGGAVVAWEDLRTSSFTDVYVQRVDGNGDLLWTSDGVAVCTALWNQTNIQLVGGENGSVTVTWEDARDPNQLDIYASLVAANGTVPPTSAPIPEPATGNLASYPNPFNPRTTVLFTLDRRQPVSLSVHDLMGRRLVSLADDVLAVGGHRLEWDGRDASGREVGSGVYLLRLETRDLVEFHGVMLIR
jgi:hypothetical protein